MECLILSLSLSLSVCVFMCLVLTSPGLFRVCVRNLTPVLVVANLAVAAHRRRHHLLSRPESTRKQRHDTMYTTKQRHATNGIV